MSLKNKRLTKGVILEKNNAERGVTLTIEHDASNERASYTVKTPALSAGAPIVMDLPEAGTDLLSNTNTITVQNKTLDATNTIDGATIINADIQVEDLTLTKQASTPPNAPAGKVTVFVPTGTSALASVDEAGSVKNYRVTTDAANQVYVTDATGPVAVQTTISYSASADLISTIPQRTADGQLKANTLADGAGGAAPTDLANRAYVQAAVAGVITTVTMTLPDNTITDIATLPLSAITAIQMAYSLVRGANVEAGRIAVITNGTLVGISVSGASAGASTGVSFFAVVAGTDLVISATTTNTGTSARLKFQPNAWLA